MVSKQFCTQKKNHVGPCVLNINIGMRFNEFKLVELKLEKTENYMGWRIEVIRSDRIKPPYVATAKDTLGRVKDVEIRAGSTVSADDAIDNVKKEIQKKYPEKGDTHTRQTTLFFNVQSNDLIEPYIKVDLVAGQLSLIAGNGGKQSDAEYAQAGFRPVFDRRSDKAKADPYSSFQPIINMLKDDLNRLKLKLNGIYEIGDSNGKDEMGNAIHPLTYLGQTIATTRVVQNKPVFTVGTERAV